MSALPHPRFGLFDHVDRFAAPLAQIFEERLRLLAEADRLGYYCYHLAEHHATPLGLAPSPGLLLAAASQRTRRIRLCPLVYPLPLYNPLRLVEEIGMLDQLTGGRLEVGVGRGGSPYELAYCGVDPERAQAMFEEAVSVLRCGLARGRVSAAGEFYTFRDVPIEVRTRQDPFPPFWYGASSRKSLQWVASEGWNVVAGGPLAELRRATDVYREALADAPAPAPAHPAADGPRIGAVRRLVVAESDAEAVRIAAPAYALWYDNLTKLWRDFGAPPERFCPDLESAMEQGVALVGSPATVTAEVARYFSESGCNYLLGAVDFGNLGIDAALRTLELFAAFVMPSFPPDPIRRPTS
ncbi:MAG TPA: LLM class flavin-dependent oxidoreductase [Thermoanaerobaculia bacterium]|nr:LLM class flavin-dependent oxidoreductase [Thermoanaerobaculia bacterium]